MASLYFRKLQYAIQLCYDATSKNEFNQKLEIFKEKIALCKPNILLDSNAFDFNLLQSTLFSKILNVRPLHMCKNKHEFFVLEKRAIVLLDVFLEAINAKKISPDLFKQKILMHRSNEILPLQIVLQTGSHKILIRLMSLFEQYQDALEHNFSDDLLLQTTVQSGSAKNFDFILNILQKNSELLYNNLKSKTEAGFMIVQSALRAGNKENIFKIFKLLKEHPLLLEENLNNQTACFYMGLFQITAAPSFDIDIFKITFDHLKDYEEALKKTLSNSTSTGFMILQSVLKTKSEEATSITISILTRFSDLMLMNLKNVTNDGYTVLLQAVISGNIENLKKIVVLLNSKEIPQDVVLLNLYTVNDFGFNPLQQAVIFGNEEIVDIIINFYKNYLCLEDPCAKEWKNILMAKNEKGFNLFHSAAKTHNNNIFDRIRKEILIAFGSEGEAVLTALTAERNAFGYQPFSFKNVQINAALLDYREEEDKSFLPLSRSKPVQLTPVLSKPEVQPKFDREVEKYIPPYRRAPTTPKPF